MINSYLISWSLDPGQAATAGGSAWHVPRVHAHGQSYSTALPDHIFSLGKKLIASDQKQQLQKKPCNVRQCCKRISREVQHKENTKLILNQVPVLLGAAFTREKKTHVEWSS